MTGSSPGPMLDQRLRERLAAEASAAAVHAYAPYSGFRVGAAVLGSSGSIYRGANIENASLGLGTCAERVALAAARLGGEKELFAIAVACIDAAGASLEQRMPCGACRQWIAELAPKAAIIVVGEGQSFTVDELLPRPFRLGS
jgi:cytidine deaminase